MSENGHKVIVTKSKYCFYCGKKLNKRNSVFDRYVPYCPSFMEEVDGIINHRYICKDCNSLHNSLIGRLSKYYMKICDIEGLDNVFSVFEIKMLRKQIKKTYNVK